MLDIIKKPKRWINLKKISLFKGLSTKSSKDSENVMILEKPSEKVSSLKSLPQPISIEIENFSAADAAAAEEEQNNLIQRQQQHDESKCSLYVVFMIHFIVICIHLSLLIFVFQRFIYNTNNNNNKNE